ncbi:hypothetical protein FIBSPDRAFT_939007 [Athelia psychrophila]|uniref:Uncharacterized protein n=1 Tax=Athelia psychrophila TaxID=1759441 RepID=A0A167WUI8_9AGAM|nr:hypothetical protein FIBSPDRAFT_939986 [Fibularhizoctonia sp. CBS 109695]KZP08375.1 hypothetical protein FIBSPDRAFT_939007 [Fibularhizoctonia sp. CBS 109695]
MALGVCCTRGCAPPARYNSHEIDVSRRLSAQTHSLLLSLRRRFHPQRYAQAVRFLEGIGEWHGSYLSQYRPHMSMMKLLIVFLRDIGDPDVGIVITETLQITLRASTHIPGRPHPNRSFGCSILALHLCDAVFFNWILHNEPLKERVEAWARAPLLVSITLPLHLPPLHTTLSTAIRGHSLQWIMSFGRTIGGYAHQDEGGAARGRPDHGLGGGVEDMGNRTRLMAKQGEKEDRGGYTWSGPRNSVQYEGQEGNVA